MLPRTLHKMGYWKEGSREAPGCPQKGEGESGEATCASLVKQNLDEDLRLVFCLNSGSRKLRQGSGEGREWRKSTQIAPNEPASGANLTHWGLVGDREEGVSELSPPKAAGVFPPPPIYHGLKAAGGELIPWPFTSVPSGQQRLWGLWACRDPGEMSLQQVQTHCAGNS